MAKNKKIDSMSVDQFKQFIKGLSFFDENWVPNKTQWEHIKELIDHLKPEVTTIEPKLTTSVQNTHALSSGIPEYRQGGDYHNISNADNQSNFPKSNFPTQPRLSSNEPKLERLGGELILPPARDTGSEFV